MNMRHVAPIGVRAVAVALAAAVGLSAVPVVFAQSDARTPPVEVRPGSDGLTVSTRVTGGQTSSVLGSAWYSDNTPIPRARLRLRNVQSGEIAAATVADDEGQFTFTGMAIGSYVVELVSDDEKKVGSDDTGKILTIGQPFTIGPGETVATFVRLGTKVPWFIGFFGNAALAVSAAAAAAGLTALAPEQVRPVSGRQ